MATLELDMEPVREPLQFDLNLDDVPEDVAQTMLNIKQVAESLLYHWKKFPIILPPSITDAVTVETELTKPLISFKDLFRAPTFDELEEVAVDKDGFPKKLSAGQLRSVRENGEFEVPSMHFPGQVHRWRLTQLLQKGTVRSHNCLLDDLALSLRLLIITARNRFHSHFFSLSQAVKSIGRGLWQILDIFIGMPHNTPGNIYEKLYEEHMRYLVAELDIRPVCKIEWLNLCDYVKEKCKQLELEKQKTLDFRPPPVPYRFQTPKGAEIDLRLFSKDLMTKCQAVLKTILEREAKGWHVKYKDRLLAELKDMNLKHEVIVERVNQSILDEYLRRVFTAILQSGELETIQPRIGSLLVQQAKALLVMTQATDNLQKKMSTHKNELEAHLVKTYPVRSRIRAWRNERLQDFERDFTTQNQWCAHEESMAMCREQSLDQAFYFLTRDLTFMRDRDPVLRKELGKVKIPKRVFTFKRSIWFPRNWVIKRHLHGEAETIPTVIVDTPSTAVPTRSDAEPVFYVTKHVYFETSTRYPFWRWRNYLRRTLCLILNGIFWLGIVIPWCSLFSLRALFFPRPFLPDLELSQVNLRNPDEPTGFTTYGTLCPKQSSLTHTLASRLRLLWQHVRDSLEAFENAPDRGFLGKTFTRHLCRFWNYVVKGAIGSTLLVLLFPPLCLIISLLSLTMAILTPLWMPIVTLLVHLFFVIFCDIDHQDDTNRWFYLFEALIWQILILGLLQPLGALFTGIVLCPLASAFILLAGVFRRGGRAVWDAFMFHAVIKKRARVPASDTFVARRTEGPGLATHYFYQIRPEQVLAAAEAQMELHEVNAWMDATAAIIDQPKKDFNHFVTQMFKPFSAGLSEEGVYKNLDKETKHLHLVLKREGEQRKQRLLTGLNPDLQERIKLTSRELKVIVAQTAKMLESFYPDHVMRRLSKTEEEFWEGRNLDINDWQGLATQLLSETFSSSFLSPLEEADTCFKLEVDHLDLARYLEMLKSAEFRDDLDVASAVHTPKGDIDVEAPYLDRNVFIPVRTNEGMHLDYDRPQPLNRRRPWKRAHIRYEGLEKMIAPLPLPHPAMVALMVHNRENDQDPIDMESPFCQRLLRAAEALPYLDPRDPAMVDFYEGEFDLSTTPDHTTNSEPECPHSSHLAEAEGAFSEDNCIPGTPESMPEVMIALSEHSTYMPPRVEFVPERVEYVPEMVPERAEYVPEREGSSPDMEAAIVYHESEADNSCVLEK